MKKYVKIINIIDRSGSMLSMLDAAIGGFNSFLEEQKDVEGKAVVTTVMFSNLYNKMYESVDVSDVKYLNKENYVPGGTTALYDAIGRTIDEEIELLSSIPKKKRPSKTLCVILTDGYENASRSYSREKIKSMVEEMKKEFDWEFIFLAANEDAAFTADGIGISKGNSYSFTNTSDGLRKAYKAVNYASRVYRTSAKKGVMDLMDTYRKEQDGTD